MYSYDDEDNAPMIDHDGHNPTIYKDGAEMRIFDKGIDIPHKPDDGCWNCCQYDGDCCHKHWNNNEPEYYIDWRDDKAPDDKCDDWQEEPGVDWKDYFIDFGGNEP
jgi:hypothetical protein